MIAGLARREAHALHCLNSITFDVEQTAYAREQKMICSSLDGKQMMMNVDGMRITSQSFTAQNPRQSVKLYLPGRQIIYVDTSERGEIHFGNGNRLIVEPKVRLVGSEPLEIVFQGAGAKVQLEGEAAIGKICATLGTGGTLQVSGNAMIANGAKIEAGLCGKPGKVCVSDWARVGVGARIVQQNQEFCHIGGETVICPVNSRSAQIVDSILLDQTTVDGSLGESSPTSIVQSILIGKNQLNGEISLENARLSCVVLGLSNSKNAQVNGLSMQALSIKGSEEWPICMHDCWIQRTASLEIGSNSDGTQPFHLNQVFWHSDSPSQLIFKTFQSLVFYFEKKHLRDMYPNRQISRNILYQFEEIALRAWRKQRPGNPEQAPPSQTTIVRYTSPSSPCIDTHQ